MLHDYAIVPVAGSGSRFGEETPKPIACRVYTLFTRCKHPRIETQVVVLLAADGATC